MLPLHDKTVLVTRSKNQATELITQLRDLGANTLTLPLIKNTAINQNELVNKLAHTNYDWMIFTSVNTARFFFESISPKTLTSKIAVVGEKTGQFIKELGLQIDYTPTVFTGKQLAKEIPISSENNILIPRSNIAKNDLIEILESRNCTVETLSIYENTPVNYSTPELNHIFNQKIDFITFTSGSIVKAFTDLSIDLNEEKIICIGPETAKIAAKYKFSVDAIATPHTVGGVIKAMVSLC